MACVCAGESILRASGSVVEVAETISANYVGPLGKTNEVLLWVDFTPGSLTKGEIWILAAPNNTKAEAGLWYKEAVLQLGEVSGEMPTLEGRYSFNVDCRRYIASPHMFRYVTVSWKGTGTNTGSNLEILLTCGEM